MAPATIRLISYIKKPCASHNKVVAKNKHNV